MEHIICRCKHCNKQYTYCTYGNGPEYNTESGCTRDYCGECGTAIQKALSKIPRKVIIYFKEIEFDDDLLTALNAIKYSYYKDNSFPPVTKIEPELYFDENEEYVYNHNVYRTSNNPVGTIHIYKGFEEVNEKKTDKPYFEPNGNKFCYLQSMVKTLMTNQAKPIRIKQPDGFPIYWDLDTPGDKKQ